MKYIFLVLCLFSGLLSYGQTTKFRFDGTVSNLDANKNEGGVTVSVVQNGTTLFTATSSSSGRYLLTGDINYSQPFDVVFAKAGFIGKKVNFNFSGANPEDLPASAEFKPVTALDMTLFGSRPNVDFGFLATQPIAQFSWDAKKGAADLNTSQAAQMRTKIDQLLLDAEKNAGEAEAKYNAAIQEADKQYAAKSYEAALAKYEEALAIKPKEKHPTDRILELDGIIQKMKSAELADKQENAEYYNLIQAADNFRNAKDYEKAKAKYTEAITKKAEQYPKDEIAKIDAILKEKENQAAYDSAIELGDIMLKQKSFKAARDKYLEATKLKPSEQYPKTKLAELDAKIKEAEAAGDLKKKYEDAVAAADALFTDEKWEESKAKYKEALAIESASTYVSGRIKIIDETLEKQKAEKEKTEKIAKLLNEGSLAQAAKKYEDALAKYKEVLTLDAENGTAKPKVTELEGLIADAAKNAALEAQFSALVKKGDDAVTAKKLVDAKTNYEQAIALKTDAAVQSKLNDVNKQLDDLKNAEEINKQYAALLAEGKATFDAKDYTTSLTKYEAAKSLKPQETAPQAKIDEIKAILKKLEEENAKNEGITKLLSEGEVLMAAQNWEGAKGKFNEVMTLAPTNATAIAKIKEIDAKLLELKNAADKEAKFNDWVAKGDADASADKLPTAITNYKEALKLKADESVQQKINTIQATIDQRAGESEKNAKYDVAIKEGDKLFAEKKYEGAKTKYQDASAIKSSENYPKDQIVAIDKLITEQNSAKEKQDQITKLLAEGTTLLTAKDYQPAKTKFEEVLTIDNANATAQTKLNEVNAALAKLMDQEAKDKEFNQLKQEGLDLLSQSQLNPAKTKFQAALQVKDDADVKKKIAEIDATLKAATDKEAKIASLLTDGQKQLDAKSFATAKSKYEEVLTLDGSNQEAQQKLLVIADELAKQMNAEQQNAEFLKLKKEGMDLAKANDYSNAKSKLQQALSMKEDSEVSAKITEIDGIISADQAKKDKINSLLNDGQNLFSQAKFTDAKSKFQEVIALESSNATAISQIKLIDAELAKLNSAEQQKAEFEKLKKDGFDLATAKNWNPAKANLAQALGIQEDASVRQKISEIDAAIAAEGQNAQMDQQYAALMTSANDLAAKKNYLEAINKYKEASTLKPNEQLPKSKVAELNTILDGQAKNAELDAKYNGFLEKGDELVMTKDYAGAITEYNKALALKPTEQVPVDKAKKAQELADLAGKNDFEIQYEKIINTISQKISENDFTKAKELITRAQGMKPEDKRPQSMLDEILAIEKRSADFAALMQKGKTEGDAKNYDIAINNYEQAKSLIPSNPEPDAKIAALRQLMEAENGASEQEKLFKEYFSAGERNETSKKYEEALSSYQNALNVKPNDAATIAKIDVVKGKMEELANLKQASAENQNKFNATIKEADDLFKTGAYNLAVDKYASALELMPDNTYAKKQLIESQNRNRLDAGKELEREYRKIIDLADRYFRSSDYTKATEYYKRAISVRSSDNYPKMKLSEIDAILNPSSQAGPELLPLGEVYDNSIMDGTTALAKAEEERKGLKTNKVKNKLNNIKDAETEMTSNKTAEHLSTSNEIYSIYKSISIQTTESDVNRQESVEKVRIANNQRAEEDRKSGLISHSELINSQGYLNDVNKTNALEYGERESVYTSNAEGINKIRVANENDFSYKSDVNYISNINTGEKLDSIRINTGDESIANQNKRIDASLKIEDIRKNSTVASNELAVLNYDKTLSNSGEIKNINASISADESLKTLKPGENHLAVKDIRYIAAEKDGEKQTIQQFNVISTDQQLIQFERAYSENEAAQTAKQGENILYVNQLDKKAQLAAVENNYSDEQERLGLRKNVETINSDQGAKSVEEADKRKMNGVKMDDVKKTITAESANTAKGKTESIYATKQALDKVENKKPVSAVIANSVGEEYPEGVSQEVFQQKDENGIMKAILTRRVVVKEGRGEVYVKSETIHATTYTKNGNPITEYVWQQETNAAGLQRHFK